VSVLLRTRGRGVDLDALADRAVLARIACERKGLGGGCDPGLPTIEMLDLMGAIEPTRGMWGQPGPHHEVRRRAVEAACTRLGCGPRVSGDREDLLAKIRALAIARYGEASAVTMKKFFLTYDRDGNQCLDKEELKRLVADSGFSLWYASDGQVAQAILDDMDRDPRKGCVSWADYRRGTGLPEDAPPQPPPPPPPPPPVAKPPPSSLSTSMLSIAVEAPVSGGVGVAPVPVAVVKKAASAPSLLIGGLVAGLGVLAIALARS